jgi:hypothetical protein
MGTGVNHAPHAQGAIARQGHFQRCASICLTRSAMLARLWPTATIGQMATVISHAEMDISKTALRAVHAQTPHATLECF